MPRRALTNVDTLTRVTEITDFLLPVIQSLQLNAPFDNGWVPGHGWGTGS